MDKKILISKTSTIKQALKKLNVTGENCLLVVENNKLLGTLTDGDLRRSILKGYDLKSNIDKVYNKHPETIIDGDFKISDVGQVMITRKLDLIPIVDAENNVLNYLTWEQVFDNESKFNSKKICLPVVIMAGGKGTRLKPFTDILPKPLVPIHNKPIIEHIIEKFTEVGCNDFYLTVNYKSKILKAYFEELIHNYSVFFVNESEPLGTAGSLRFLENKFDSPIFVTNCDIIIKADYRKIWEFHKDEQNDVTLVASTKEFIIPYGTCDLNQDGYLDRINEKPTYELLINTGLYILNPELLKKIPKNKFYHITHLIEDLKNEGKKVGVFPIDEDAWIDIGQWNEYKRAVELL
jgi:dTDP-glucose pyrophosphorylase